jgi:glycerophosphoryl diester phosphodiesterase
MRITAFVLGVLLVTSCASTSAEKTPKVTVIAHRGASAYAPENTLAAFSLAADMHADYFELDVTLSADDEIIVIHDLSVDRTTDGIGNVRSLTLSDLKKLDAGSKKDAKFAGERLPTLRESLELAKERGIKVYIEIKNSDDDTELMKALTLIPDPNEKLLPGHVDEAMERVGQSGTLNLKLTRKTIDLVRELKMQKQIVIQSFSPIVCLCSLVLAPELRTEFLGSRSDKRPEEWPMYLVWANLLTANGHNLSKGTISPELMSKLRTDGRTVAIWTVDDELEMRQFVEMGADAIITNKPDVCLKVLGEMGRR